MVARLFQSTNVFARTGRSRRTLTQVKQHQGGGESLSVWYKGVVKDLSEGMLECRDYGVGHAGTGNRAKRVSTCTSCDTCSRELT